MCGILGALSKCPSNGLNERFQQALAALDHRGPDNRGLETLSTAAGRLTLGHTRLSIIDLTPAGHQPMQSADGRYTIVFNGEIYNYRELREELRARGADFRTDSDTEVLLTCWAFWGTECLQRLAGMFAFAVFDRIKQRLTCARDAFGIKPLFYRLDNEGFLFASEIPALVRLWGGTPRLNAQRAYDYLVYGRYDDTEKTFFDGIEHLLPGHVLVLDLAAMVGSGSRPSDTAGSPMIRRWWWPRIEERTDLSFEQAAERLREMFLENVRLHLRSDVPLGAALSGGVDSSAVVCAMRHLEPEMPIHTFSFVARGSAVDEEHWVDRVNAHVDAIPHKVLIQPDQLAADLDDMVAAQGEPFGSTSIYAQYRVFREARAQGITVTLEGQGADELMGGYTGYPAARMRSLAERGRLLALAKFTGEWSKWPGRSRTRAMQFLAAGLLPKALYPWALRFAGIDPAPAWLNLDELRKMGVDIRASAPFPRTPEARGRRLSETLRATLSGGNLASLLRHSDRNAMHWSIESRVPFLTIGMAEFLLQLPEHYLVSSTGESKRILRAAMRGLVPDEILDRRDKVGFATPEQDWMHALGPHVLDWVEASNDIPFLNGKRVQSLVWELVDGQRPFDFQAWRLISFCHWYGCAGLAHSGLDA